MANIKTNAMRILDKTGVSYDVYSYETGDGAIDGISVANKIGKPVEIVYKTLVTMGLSKEYYVFIIPVHKELNLKEAARVVGEKSLAMIKVSDITKITGYIRGGCSPIGMKKEYKTVLDVSCKEHSKIIISAGRIGSQIELSTEDLINLTKGLIEKVTH